MNAEDETRMPKPPTDDELRIPGTLSSNENLYLRKIEGLLTEVDNQALYLRNKIAELLKEENALRQITRRKDSLEKLVVQLREANQNLVLSTFGAQDMQAQAEASYHRQEEFLSMLAHELRSPLAPITAAAELLGTIAHSHRQLPKLQEIISRQAKHLSRLVADLMDASRVSSGKITLDKATLLISEVVEGAVETSKPFIDKRDQHLTVDLPPEPMVIAGDMVRLVQLFSNLLINASKFTPEGGEISLSLCRLGRDVSVSVKDDGVGIAPDLQPFIFDLFAQGPGSLDRSQGGLGIGLSLVRNIAEMHGGTAQVISGGAGQGSEFIVTLPILDQPPGLERLSLEEGFLSSTSTTIGPCRILIINDDIDGNEILNKLLTQQGHTAASAFNGVSGLEMAVGNAYDVIICDVGLPGMNGYEVVRQLRKLSIDPMPLFIAMTGYNQESHLDCAMEAGFDHYLVKPIVTSELMPLISSRMS